MTCALCPSQEATPTLKALNGLPKGILACPACVEAVKQRQVGVVVKPDGSLEITDGRFALSSPSGERAR